MRVRVLISCFFLIAATVSSLGQQMELVVQSGHSGPLKDAVINPTGDFVVSCGEDKRIIVWDVLTQKQYGVLSGHKASVEALAFGKDPYKLYSVGMDGVMGIWDVRDLKNLKQIQVGESLGAMDFDPKHDRMVLGGVNLHLYDIQNAKLSHVSVKDNQWIPRSAVISDVKFHEAGSQLAFADGDSRLVFVDLEGDQSKHISTRSTKCVLPMAKTGVVVSGGASGLLAKDNTRGLNTTFRWTDAESVNALTHAGDEILCGTGSGRVKRISSRTLLSRKGKRLHEDEVVAVDYCEAKELYLSADKSGVIKLSRGKDFAPVAEFSSHVKRIESLATNHTGDSLWVGYRDGSVRAFDLSTASGMYIEPLDRNLSERQYLQLTSLRYENGKVVADVLKHKLSTEFIFLSERIDAYKQEMTPTGKIAEVSRLKESPNVVRGYFEKIESGDVNPHQIIDPTNLTCRNESLGVEAHLDGGWVVLSGIKDHQEVSRFRVDHDDRITSVALSQEARTVITASWDGLIKFWDLDDGHLKLTLGLFNEEDFVFVDAESHYYASKGAFPNLGARMGHRMYSFEQFDLLFNRPDLILAQMEGIVGQETVDNYHRAYLKRLSKLGVRPEDLKLTGDVPEQKLEYDVALEKGELTIRGSFDGKGSALSSLHVRVNGVPEYGTHGLLLKGQQLDTSLTIPLSHGMNVVQVFVENQQGTASLYDTRKIPGAKTDELPDLYFISVATNAYGDSRYNLNYAEKDATDMEDMLNLSKAFTTMHTLSVSGEQVTREALGRMRTFLSQAGLNDRVVVFFAGHGLLSEDLDYYLATYDTDFLSPDQRAIPFDSMASVLENCASRFKCMILDACHSGELDKEEVVLVEQDEIVASDVVFRSVGAGVENKNSSNSFELAKALFGDLRPHDGSTIISSASGGEFAMESDDWGNGVFTFAMLEALSGKNADMDGDSKVSLEELKRYVLTRVEELTQGRQHPTSRTENMYNDFRIR